MSISQWIGRLQVAGFFFYYARFETQEGHVPLIYQMIQEPLRAGGVDGVRWLDDHRETPIFQVATWEDAPDQESASALATNYELSRSEYGILTFVTNGVTHQANVKVIDIAGPASPRPKVRGGALCGFGATPGYLAYVDAVWALQVVF